MPHVYARQEFFAAERVGALARYFKELHKRPFSIESKRIYKVKSIGEDIHNLGNWLAYIFDNTGTLGPVGSLGYCRVLIVIERIAEIAVNNADSRRVTSNNNIIHPGRAVRLPVGAPFGSVAFIEFYFAALKAYCDLNAEDYKRVPDFFEEFLESGLLYERDYKKVGDGIFHLKKVKLKSADRDIIRAELNVEGAPISGSDKVDRLVAQILNGADGVTERCIFPLMEDLSEMTQRAAGFCQQLLRKVSGRPNMLDL